MRARKRSGRVRGVGANSLMVKRLLLITIGLLLVVAAWPAYNFGVVLGFWPPLTRPRPVTASAHYVSMIEEGTWFDCSVDSKRNVDTCKAWAPDGRLIASGDFRLEGEDRAATRIELKPTLARS